ncbi:CoA-transferase family III [Colletotrichum abscissum]|uniref:CoA-transferase family III n=1 Tax=Colletotrichum abscissum TaxID=1671311 RepID=A0A9Q0B7N5_9PEZI|nr:CoA-transferase family III [Colletotrichum abscissum]KAI3556369.1 CoA-transferase family III [Colletotrichum abscissum]KAK1475585.1 CoA-transferase family III [Colletotrichum abscissum]
MADSKYSSVAETKQILDLVLSSVQIPAEAEKISKAVQFSATRDLPYFPIPFKETELASALKAIEGGVAGALAATKDGVASGKKVSVSLEKSTAFLIQAYLATVGGYGKLDKEVKQFLKDTDLLQAQSDPYRRMSANLYETKQPGEYYHIHGSLEASTTLGMIGLEAFRPDLKDHSAIVEAIESHVKQFSVDELERMNADKRQAGVPVLKHEDFIKTPHGKTNTTLPPWSVDSLETSTPPAPLPTTSDKRVLSGVKVLELCRIIAGPVIGRILAEYGADVLKITSPNLSDVPFFQVDGNMGKHAADLDLKTEEGRKHFETLLAEADVVLDGYRPGALEKLGYGATALTKLAKERGKGFVYVNENCFGYQGEWCQRPGWQQIADCVSGVAWAQGQFMGLDEPVVPPFPISDYGTGCMGAIAALTGLYNRATQGGSWHGKASLLQYDLLLIKAGKYPEDVQEELRKLAGDDFLALRHSHSVDQISGTALKAMKGYAPELFSSPNVREKWYARRYKAEVEAVSPVVEIEGVEIGFKRASRPNGSDEASWDFGPEEDHRIVAQTNGVKKA